MVVLILLIPTNFCCMNLDCRVEASALLGLAEPSYVPQDAVYEMRQ